MKGLFTFYLLLFATMASVDVSAQSFYSFRRDRDFLLTFGTGATSYLGELSTKGQFGDIKPNLLVGGEYFVTDRISTGLDLAWFKIGASDADAKDDRNERNLSFTSSCIELAVTGNIYLVPQGVRFYQRPKLNPYFFAGVGMIYMNPTAIDSLGRKQALQPLMTENVKYSKFQFVIPFGFGLKIKVNPFVNLVLEGGYRKTFTDYLDDVSSTRYVKLNDLIVQTATARELSDRRQGKNAPLNDEQRPTKGRRGNPATDDNYFMANIKIQYYLPHQVFKGTAQRKLYRSKRKMYYKRR
jgi:hypothetical protein